MDSGAEVKGVEWALGGRSFPRRASSVPSHLAPKPLHPEHASLAPHGQPRRPVCAVENCDASPLENPFPCRGGSRSTSDRYILRAGGILVRDWQTCGHLGKHAHLPIASDLRIVYKV